MNQYLQTIRNLLQEDSLSPQDKEALLKALAEADKQWNITDFKLVRAEKVKHTTGVLLEETIEELEQKRKAVEAQNRELEIEAALERVRSRTMAMQSGKELQNVTISLYDQLKNLGFKNGAAAITIMDASTGDMDWWMEGLKENSGFLERYHVNYFSHRAHIEQLEHWKNGTPYATIQVSGDEKKAYDKVYFFDTDFVRVPEETKTFMMQGEMLIFSMAYMRYGAITWAPSPISDVQAKILQRFAKVFEQTYTRFLDLQNAEAQARESQIQLALERVRARTMAMHKSEELTETAQVLFQQLIELGNIPDRISIGIVDETKEVLDVWLTDQSGGQISGSFTARLNERTLIAKLYKAWKEQQRSIIIDLHDSELDEWLAFVREEMKIPVNPEFIKNRRVFSIAFFSHGWIMVAAHEKPQPEMVQILERFASVFNLTYRRFLDLQKAETQAKETQIQLALERVRARTMAMYESAELAETAVLLFEQLKSLGLNLRGCGFNIWEKEEKICDAWMNTPDGKLTASFKLPLTEQALFRRFYESRQNGEEFWVHETEKKELIERYQYLATLPELRESFAKDRRENIEIPKLIIDHVVNFSHGNLIFITYEQCPDAWEIFKRFGKVFEQTYTRFKDLQKAEAQAREAKIEAALERVRAKTMAMHHSDELAQVATTLFEQMSLLDNTPERINIGIANEGEKAFEFWATDQEGKLVNKFFKAEFDKSPVVLEMYNAWKSKEQIFIQDLHGDRLAQWIHYIKDVLGVPFNPQYLRNHRFLSWIFFMHGIIGITTGDTPGQDTINLIQRFAKVFEQTYTRFLDLQKAEAQAREAQIEAALERVRSKAMAMYKSDDIATTASAAFEELKKLGIHSYRCGVGLLSKNSRTAQVYAAIIADDGSIQTIVRTPDMGEHPALERQYHAWLEQKDIQEELKGEALLTYYKLPFLQADAKKMAPIDFTKPKYGYYFSFSDGLFYSWSDIPYMEDEKEILKRFRSIIALTFRRFLDLQRAEAQAREAQIQLALERVRAKTMSMHNSDDVGETIATMFVEFKNLGIHTNRCGILIFTHENIAEVWTARSTGEGNAKLIIGRLDLDAHKMLRSVYNAWKAKNEFYQYDLLDDDLIRYYNAINNSRFYPTKFDLDALPAKEFHSDFFFTDGAVFSFTNEPVEKSNANIINRFAAVFSLTYRRYLDLVKAEAQAREAQIEAALERVRSRSMGMQKSEEMPEVLQLIFRQISQLGTKVDTATFTLDYKATDDFNCYFSTPDQAYPVKFYIPYFDNPVFNDFKNGKKDSAAFFSQKHSLEEKNTFFNHLFKYAPAIPQPRRDFLLSSPGYATSVALMENIALGIINYDGEPYSENENVILRRFGKVFEQSYTRFLDLQRAEAQAREAQIEAALEKVRSRTMGMHNSEDVSAATATMFTELEKLGIENFRGGIAIFRKDMTQEVWSVNNLAEGKIVKAVGVFDMKLHPFWVAMYKEWEQKNDFYYYFLAGQEKEDYVSILNAVPNYFSQPIQNFPDVHFQIYFFNEGAVFANSLEAHSEEDKQIMKRFASVFALTFRRYQDLKKAEAQAREAQIEVSLEKVRSRSLAMHKSDELKEAGELLWNELGKLGIESLSSGYVLMDKEEKIGWIYAPNPVTGKIAEPMGVLHTETKEMQKVLSAWKKQEPLSIVEMNEQETIVHQTFIAEKSLKTDGTILHWITAEQLINLSPKRLFLHNFNFKQGYLLIVGGNRLTDTQVELMLRFTKVFQQTYTRFLDLQKAETQAREAQIEAALERVRSRSMGMQKSEELKEVIQVVYEQFVHLNIKIEHTGFVVDYNPGGDWHFWIADKHAVPSQVTIPYFDSEWGNRFDQAKEKGKDFFATQLNFEEKNKFYQDLLKHITGLPEEAIAFYFSCPGLAISTGLFEDVSLYIENFSGTPYSNEENATLMRFGKVFQQTYTRFLDLQKAEAQALEAIKRASVDRVRAEIASMRTTSDLERITPLIWNELTTLGIPFIRCGVFIMDEESQKVHAFLSTPEGKAIASLHIPFDFNLSMITNGVSHWRRKKMYKEYWDAKAFVRSWTALSSLRETHQVLHSQEQPPENLYLHMLPFLQGMLYVGSTAPLHEKELELVQNLADAFSTAYARYEDFNRLESAKKQVDSTLNELQTTQKQLIQSEKMASLGELTAGIAHEIQNPLNFVNNFSEVNKELLAELNEEIEKGNIGEAKIILADISGNEEKISHHGKRADSIVKGMLQHSRSSSTTKEPTDINTLADEYFRLAYHGLRSKDKSFNAAMKNDFDRSIGKINVIPQDIGRVLLNLFNNAFYAVNEKKNKSLTLNGENRYEPTVSIKTRSIKPPSGGIGVEIRVSDNGAGIPQKVVDKIFQPFFTTKPTGSGTGLGLSLAYDIVKAHGGELKVETKEGEGSEFIIQLPV
jgi:signal transduction histidine kinase